MERLSSKLLRVGRSDGYSADGALAHWCPACNELHPFAVDQPFANKARWSFDSNLNQPTFGPSMNIRTGPFPDGHLEVCHYFLRRGQLQYLGDCTHELKGKTVPLPDLPVRYLHPSGEQRMAKPSTTAAARAVTARSPAPAPVQPSAVMPAQTAPALAAVVEDPTSQSDASRAPVTDQPDAGEIDEPDEELTNEDIEALLKEIIEELPQLVARVDEIESKLGNAPELEPLRRAHDALEARFHNLEQAVGARLKSQPIGAGDKALQDLMQRVTKIEMLIRHMV